MIEKLGKKTGQRSIDKKTLELDEKMGDKNQKIIKYRYCQ